MPSNRIEDLGALYLLAGYGEDYLRLPLHVLSDMFQEPIMLGQYRVYRANDGFPVAAVTWATLTDEASEKFATGNYILRPGEWDAGDNFWFVDFMAPFNNAKEVVSHIRHSFTSHPAFARWPLARSIRPDGRVMTWRKARARVKETA